MYYNDLDDPLMASPTLAGLTDPTALDAANMFAERVPPERLADILSAGFEKFSNIAFTSGSIGRAISLLRCCFYKFILSKPPEAIKRKRAWGVRFNSPVTEL